MPAQIARDTITARESTNARYGGLVTTCITFPCFFFFFFFTHRASAPRANRRAARERAQRDLSNVFRELFIPLRLSLNWSSASNRENARERFIQITQSRLCVDRARRERD